MNSAAGVEDFPDRAARYAHCYVNWVNKSKARKGAEAMTLNKEQELQAKNHLTNVSVLEISVCGVPAVPDATFAVMKARNVSAQGGVEKVIKADFIVKDARKKQLFAYVLVPDVVDWQGDVISAAEVEKACNSFMMNLGKGEQLGTGTGLNHQIFEQVGYPIQSAIDVDGALGKALGFPNPIPGAWLFGLQASDVTWKSVEKKELTGFSIGGFGDRTPISALATKSKDVTEPGLVAKALIAALAKTGYVAISKEILKAIDFDTAYISERIWDELPGIMYAMEDAIYSIAYDETLSNQEKGDKIRASVKQFNEKLLELFGQAQKSYDAMKAVVDDVRKAIPQANATKDKSTKANTATGGQEGVLEMEITPQALDKMIADAIVKSQQDNTLNKTLADLTKGLTDLKAQVEKSLEETPFGKGINENFEAVAKVMNLLMEKTFGSNGLPTDDSDRSIQTPTTKGGDGTPEMDVLKKNLAGTAFSFRKP